MAAIITEKFRIHNARQFKEDFGEAASSTFLFIGRPQDWDASDTVQHLQTVLRKQETQ